MAATFVFAGAAGLAIRRARSTDGFLDLRFSRLIKMHDDHLCNMQDYLRQSCSRFFYWSMQWFHLPLCLMT